jgi:hypothetical protein
MITVSTAVKVKSDSVADAFLDARIIYHDGAALYFVCANKADRKFERILLNGATHDRRSESRPLAKTSVLETLVKLRDDMVWKMIKLLPPDIRHNRHYTKDAAMRLLAAEDTCEELTTPDIQGVDGITIKVLKTKPGTALWIEASSSVFKFLADVVAAERSSKTVHRKQQRNAESHVETGVKGVSTVTRRGQLRARKRTVGGDVVNKYMSPWASSMSEAVAAAAAFVANADESSDA